MMNVQFFFQSISNTQSKFSVFYKVLFLFRLIISFSFYRNFFFELDQRLSKYAPKEWSKLESRKVIFDLISSQHFFND